jgi:hypothetical protein
MWGNNKIVSFSNDTVVTVRCFGADAYGACASVPAPSDLTFMVDVTQDPNFIPSGDGIYFMGGFTDPAWQAGAIKMDPVTGMPGVFTTTITGVCPGRINYKFVNGDPDNGGVEEDFALTVDSTCIEPNGVGGFNRFYVRPDAQPQTLKSIYNTCKTNIGLDENFADRSFSIYPNPFSGTTTLRLDAYEAFDVNVMDLNGKVIERMTQVSGNVTISADRMIPGVYMIQIINAAGEANVNKVVVQ